MSPFNRLFSKYIEDNNGCWNYTGALFDTGYGCFWFEGKSIAAHRASWEFHHGEIPSGMLVCHKCDNKRCINPRHLFLGTYQDNSDDMVSKGRSARSNGEDNSYVKITKAIALEIKNRLQQGQSKGIIARDLHVAYHHVTNIAYGKAWRWL